MSTSPFSLDASLSCIWGGVWPPSKKCNPLGGGGVLRVAPGTEPPPLQGKGLMPLIPQVKVHTLGAKTVSDVGTFVISGRTSTPF